MPAQTRGAGVNMSGRDGECCGEGGGVIKRSFLKSAKTAIRKMKQNQEEGGLGDNV